MIPKSLKGTLIKQMFIYAFSCSKQIQLIIHLKNQNWMIHKKVRLFFPSYDLNGIFQCILQMLNNFCFLFLCLEVTSKHEYSVDLQESSATVQFPTLNDASR